MAIDDRTALPKEQGRARQPMLPTAVLLVTWCMSAVLTARWMAEDIARGGDEWQQADWLINYGAGPIRRGALGEAVLFVSDWAGAAPLTVLAAIQIVCLVLVPLAMLFLFIKAGRPARLALLMIAPLGIAYWGTDPTVHGRKEILAYISALPLALDPGLRRALWTSAILYVVAVLGHELNVFFMPILIAIALVRTGSAGAIGVWAVAVAFVAMTATVYAGTHVFVEDPRAICAPLLDRGTEPRICTGILNWLGMSVQENRNAVADLLATLTPERVLLAAVLALAPVAATIWPSRKNLWVIGLVALAFFALVPVYAVARDWGRWLSVSVMGITLIALTAAVWRRQEADGLFVPPGRFLWVLAILTVLGISTQHYTLKPLRGLHQLALPDTWATPED